MTRASLQDTCVYRAVGGEIVGPAGWLEPDTALGLLLRYGREAERYRGRGAHQAARLCAKMAVDLAHALVASDDWRRAAAEAKRSHVVYFSLRKLIIDVKTGMYG